MSGLLHEAFLKASELPEADQEAIASLVLQEIESETRWDELFQRLDSAGLLDRLADRALEGIRAGRATRLDVDDL